MEQPKKKKGGCLKVALIVILAIIVLLAAVAGFFYITHKDELEAEMNKYHTETATGQEATDFEVTTTAGETVTMSQLLQDKEVLVVVLFATWCGPCEKEFPEMDEVYQKYKDRMSMIALDVDSLDSEEDLAEYDKNHDLSFPLAMGNDTLGVFKSSTYPTTMVIDRNGKIGCSRVGSIPTAEKFEKVITTFMGDNYEERQLGYYTFYATAGKSVVPGVEFTVTSEAGTETYTTGEDGRCDVFTDKPEDLKVRVVSVPEGYSIDGSGEIMSGVGLTYVALPVK